MLHVSDFAADASVIVLRDSPLAALAVDGRVARLGFDDITPERLADIAPARVVCPLIAPAYDARDVAQRLRSLGWRGELVAIAPGAPDPGLIAAEVGRGCPGIRVRVTR